MAASVNSKMSVPPEIFFRVTLRGKERGLGVTFDRCASIHTNTDLEIVNRIL